MYKRLLNPLKTKSFFLLGARGTGKSTLLSQIFAKQSIYAVNLLDEDQLHDLSLRPQLLAERLAALPKRPEWVVIDEVQKIPAILDVVQQLIFKTKQKFALTGSSARKLKRGGANLLAGRALVNHLYPLTWLELGNDFDLQRTLQLGSLPEVILASSDEEARQTLRAYVGTYMREEILIEQLIRNVTPFRRFLEVAAQSNGQILNMSKIGRDCGVDPTAIERYFQILEDTLVGFMLQPFHLSIRKRQAQRPKFYFFDLGVRAALENRLNVPLDSGNYLFGRLFEHYLILECMRLNDYLQKDFRFSYLMTKDSAEIDLVIERPGKKLLAVEIKSTTKVDATEINKLARLGGDIPKCELMILSREAQKRVVGDITVWPWQDGIRSLFSI